MALKMQKEAQRRRRVDPMVVAANALGITQITAWGTSYYCLGVLAKTHRCRYWLAINDGISWLQRGAAHHGVHLGVGGTADRS
jgi:hypothetical protein